MGLWETLLVTAAAGIGGTGLGGLTAALVHHNSDKRTSLLLSFAAGVMVSLSCFGLLTDAAEAGTMGLVALGMFLGCAVTAGLNSLWAAAGLSKAWYWQGLVMAAAIAVHNVPEGMVIGASFIGGSLRQGWTMAAVIGLHNIPEGMAVSAPIAAGGGSRRQAAGLAALSGAPTVLGAALGYGLGALGPGALTLTLSFAAGAMLYVVFGELLPEAAELWKSKLPALTAVLGILAGMMLG